MDRNDRFIEQNGKILQFVRCIERAAFNIDSKVSIFEIQFEPIAISISTDRHQHTYQSHIFVL